MTAKKINILYIGDDRYDIDIERALRDTSIRGRVECTLFKSFIPLGIGSLTSLDQLTNYYFGLDQDPPTSGLCPVQFDLVVLDSGFLRQPDGGYQLWNQMGDDVKAWLSRAYVAVLTQHFPSGPPTRETVGVDELMKLLAQERPATRFGRFQHGTLDEVINMLDVVFPSQATP